jgi:hypothetical protein
VELYHRRRLLHFRIEAQHKNFMMSQFPVDGAA